ncbi:agmatinase [Vibrio maritimus]|jgi:arginase family enzyme|uniref:Agmatinase n=1 Tax=Vibrio maritimus TaxID=990268 RepID=A0A090TCL9_9VIBR|nr:agmatinase [Vibrio maritimus]
MSNIKKWPAIDPEKVAKYKHIWENVSAADNLDPEVAAYLARVKEQGGGKGIEQMSFINKDYLGFYQAPFSQDLDNTDVVIYGMGIEKCSPTGSSHKFAPQRLRHLSKMGMGTVGDNGEIPFEWCRISDYGNWDSLGQFELKAEVEQLTELLHHMVVEKDCTPLVFGGDHTIPYPTMRALGEKYGPLRVIHFDAHYDLSTRADFDYPYTSGHWLPKLYSEGLADPERTVQIGMRGRQTALVKGNHIAFGTTGFTTNEVYEQGVDAVADKIIELCGDGGPVYFTFDLDALDTAFCRSNSSPDPFGLTHLQVYDIIRKVKASGKVRLVGADVAEYTPDTDPTDKDGIIAAGFGWELLCWLAEERKKENGGENRHTVWHQAFGSVSL